MHSSGNVHHNTEHLKMVKMVNFTLCVFYHNLKKTEHKLSPRLNFTTSWACSTEDDLSGYVLQPTDVTDEETEALRNGMT